MAAQMRAIVDKLLTDFSNGLFQDDYISEEIFPQKGVTQTTGKIGKYSKNHLRIERSIVGGRGEARRVTAITRSTNTYEIDEHALEGIVTPSDYRNVEDPFDAEKDEVAGLTSLIWGEKEKVVADALTDNTVLTQYTALTGTDQFSDYANSFPLEVFNTARATVYNGCGVPPNTVIMNWDVFNILRYHPAILDSLGFKYNGTGGLREQQLAEALNVDKILIGKAKYNSAKEGQTDSLASIWGKHIIFAALPDKVQKYQVTLGYYLYYQNQGPRKVYKYPIYNPADSTGIQVMDSYDYVIQDAAAGYLIQNAIA